MKRYVIASLLGCFVIVTVTLVAASTAHATTTTPPCQVFGHLEAAPGHVTAVFTVAKTCAEVSLLSWLAPDAHAGQPQTLFSRRSEVGVAPGDYRWTITAPPEGCYFQDDLVLPGGYTIDFILGGTHKCETPPSTTIQPSTSTTNVLTPTTSANPILTTTTTGRSAFPNSTMATPLTATSAPEVLGTQSTPTEELAFSGGGELWALTLGALGLIGFGRWVEHRGKRRR